MKAADPNARLLEATSVTIKFGGLTAVSDFNLIVRPHELIAGGRYLETARATGEISDAGI